MEDLTLKKCLIKLVVLISLYSMLAQVQAQPNFFKKNYSKVSLGVPEYMLYSENNLYLFTVPNSPGIKLVKLNDSGEVIEELPINNGKKYDLSPDATATLRNDTFTFVGKTLDDSIKIIRFNENKLLSSSSLVGTNGFPLYYDLVFEKNAFYFSFWEILRKASMIKFDYSGNKKWEQKIRTKDLSPKISLTLNGNYLFDLKLYQDYLKVSKFNKDGSLIDSFRYKLPFINNVEKITNAANNLLIISGTRYKDKLLRNKDLFFMGISLNGDSLWYHHDYLPFDTIPTQENSEDQINDVLALGDGTLEVIWALENYTYLTQLDKNGNIIWRSLIDTTAINFFQVEKMPNGFVLLGEKNALFYIYKTDLWGHFSSKEEIKKSQTDLEVYPNPSFGDFNISFILKKPEKVNIDVYRLSGKQVAQKYYGDLPAGENKLNIDLSGQKPGLYLYRMQIGQDAKFGKLLVR